MNISHGRYMELLLMLPTQLVEEILQLERLNQLLNDNLASVQSRCTELLEENRELKRRTFVPEAP